MESIPEGDELGRRRTDDDIDIRRVLKKVDVIKKRMERDPEPDEEQRRLKMAEADEFIARLGEDRVWERFRIYKMVEKQCEQIEREVRQKVRHEMELKKKRRAEQNDDVQKKIRSVKAEIRKEMNVDLDAKPKRRGERPPKREGGEERGPIRVTEVMPSARKKFEETMKKRGIFVEEKKEAVSRKPAKAVTAVDAKPPLNLPSAVSVPNDVIEQASFKMASRTKKPPQALTVTNRSLDEVLPVLLERLKREQERENHATTARTESAKNVGFVTASHDGCRTTAEFRSRLTAHTLASVDILPTTTTTSTLAAAVIHVEYEDEVTCNDEDEASVVQVISTVSSPSLKFPELNEKQEENVELSSNSNGSDLLMELVTREELEPTKEGEEYSDHFEEDDEGDAQMASQRTDKLSTIPEDTAESKIEEEEETSVEASIKLQEDDFEVQSQAEASASEKAFSPSRQEGDHQGLDKMTNLEVYKEREPLPDPKIDATVQTSIASVADKAVGDEDVAVHVNDVTLDSTVENLKRQVLTTADTTTSSSSFMDDTTLGSLAFSELSDGQVIVGVNNTTAGYLASSEGEVDDKVRPYVGDDGGANTSAEGAAPPPLALRRKSFENVAPENVSSSSAEEEQDAISGIHQLTLSEGELPTAGADKS